LGPRCTAAWRPAGPSQSGERRADGPAPRRRRRAGRPATRPRRAGRARRPTLRFPPGTFRARRRLAYNLRELNLANNSRLAGPFPNQAAGLTRLERVSLGGTGMSCVPERISIERANATREGRPPTDVYKCAPEQLLPCFLDFASYDVPRQDDSHMACRWAAGAAGAAGRRGDLV
jgi:hypothetical protein